VDKKPVVLSKSKYLQGLQCPKLLWYEYNSKKSFPPVDAATQAIFDEGRRVGEYAQKLFPDGIRLERDYDPRRQSQKSLEALKLRKPLFEAGFVFDRAYALADILVPAEDDAWDLIEVKSSTQVKPEHYADAAFQKYTYEGAGLKIRRCFIMYLDNTYVKQGPIEPQKLFASANITEEAAVKQKEIGQEMEAMLRAIASPTAPDIKVGPHCGNPRDCPLEDICWSFLPDRDDVFVLYRGGKLRYELMERGIFNLADIPAEELNDKQLAQVRSHRTGEPHLDRAALQTFFDRLVYPLYFLDFETIGPAIPVYDNSRPYQEIPFQYSLDVVERPGAEPVHYEYLAPGGADPRPEVLRLLYEQLGETGSIIAYSANFEIKVIKNAAEVYRDYLAWSDLVQKRFADLLEPFKNFDYYHPAQAGSASLKRVLPALTGASYSGLEINNGQAAAAEYYRVTFNNVEEKDRQTVRANLLKYCGLDTRGMIEVLKQLDKERGGGV
jgi:Domain of unknown function(DUF2779)